VSAAKAIVSFDALDSIAGNPNKAGSNTDDTCGLRLRDKYGQLKGCFET